MYNLEHPDITAALRTGYPVNYKEPEPPLCPVCGEECETVYRAGRHGDIVGCDDCIIGCDAWDAPECGCLEKD